MNTSENDDEDTTVTIDLGSFGPQERPFDASWRAALKGRALTTVTLHDPFGSRLRASSTRVWKSSTERAAKRVYSRNMLRSSATACLFWTMPQVPTTSRCQDGTFTP